VEPYVPGEQPNKPNMVKLNTNECPYPPAPGVERIAAQMDFDKMRLYPDPECKVLVNALADFYNLKPEQIFVGVGSDDVLAMCFMTFFNNEKPILFPDITYAFYDVWANLYRIPYETCPLDAEFRINPQDYKNIFICGEEKYMTDIETYVVKSGGQPVLVSRFDNVIINIRESGHKIYTLEG
jgi:histidinol-phosphate aminotransferase